MSSAERIETSQSPPGGAPEIPELASIERLPPVPADADDTRGHHFRRLLRSTATILLVGITALAVAIAGSISFGPAIGFGAAAGTIALGILVVFLIANSAAREDFFRAYAEGRSLRRTTGRNRVHPLTPLLQKGDERYTQERFDGVLPGDLEGSLCLYTIEEENRDSDGNKTTTYIHFTIAIANLPEAAPLIRELYCQRRVGFRFMDSAEDVFRRRQRVEHESENVDRRFEIFIGEGDSLNTARQILSPQFLVWLDEHALEGFAFELSAGSLVANVKGHKKSAAELDNFCLAAAAVAKRIRNEAAELHGRR